MRFLTQPASCLPPRTLFSFHSCLETLDHWTKPQEGLSEDPLTNPEEIWYTDGSSSILDGKRRAGYAVVSNFQTIVAKPLQLGASNQLAELIALTWVLELGKGKRVAIYPDSMYAFLVLHVHATIWKERGHLTTWESPIKYGDKILRLLESLHWPTEVSVSHCKGHQKGSMEMAWRKQAANHAAKRAASQNNDIIGVATLVPQTNLPETPSYTEGETLKTKSESFQEDYMGWFQKEGLLFLPGNLQWKLVNSLHAITQIRRKGPPESAKKVLQRDRPQKHYKASGLLLSHLPIKQLPRSSKTPAGPAHPMACFPPKRGLEDGFHPDASFSRV